MGVGAYHRVEGYPYPRYNSWPFGFWGHGYDPAFYGPCGPYGPYYYDSPRYFVLMDEDNAYYWDFKGEGECRLVLVYTRAGKEFTHEFLYRRQKI